MRLRISKRGRVRPSVGPSVGLSRTANMTTFEGRKSSNDIKINDTIRDDEEVASDVPPRYFLLWSAKRKVTMNLISFFQTKLGLTTKLYTINPKAMSVIELYGVLDPNTRDWTDGLLSSVFRDINKPTGNRETLWSKIEKKKHRQNSNLINHFPTSEGVSEVSERANERTEWPSTSFCILGCFRP